MHNYRILQGRRQAMLLLKAHFFVKTKKKHNYAFCSLHPTAFLQLLSEI